MFIRLYILKSIILSILVFAFVHEDVVFANVDENRNIKSEPFRESNTTQQINENNKNIKQLLFHFHDLEFKFKQIHGLYRPEAIGYIDNISIEQQINGLNHQEMIEAKRELDKIVFEIKELRQDLLQMPTETNDYSNGQWLHLIVLKKDLPKLEATINQFENRLILSLIEH